MAEGVEVDDLWADYVADPGSASLSLTFAIGTVTNIEEDQEVSIEYEVEPDYESIITVTVSENDISFGINMAALYASSLMPDFDTDVETEVTFTLNDGVNEVEKSIAVKFLGKASPEETVDEETTEETNASEDKEEDFVVDETP